jgi:hypothetical protein
MRRRRVLLAALYLICVFAWLEGASRILLRNDAFFRRLYTNDDTFWRMWWVRRHSESLSNPIYFTFDVYDPSRGWALAPNLRSACDPIVSRDKTVNSNARGLRGVTDFSYARSAGRKRVVVLGDSFTFGEGVSDDETFCAHLARALPDTDIINMGVHGYGYGQMCITLEQEGVKYRPDVVLIGFVYDDMNRTVLSFRDFAKPRFTLEGERLVLTHTPVPPPPDVLARWHSSLLDLGHIFCDRLHAREQVEEGRDLTFALIRRMAETARGIGGRPILAYLPVGGELADRSEGPSPQERLILDFARSIGLPVILLRPAFIEAEKNGVRINPEGHYGPTRHRVAAEGILPVLKAVLQ